MTEVNFIFIGYNLLLSNCPSNRMIRYTYVKRHRSGISGPGLRFVIVTEVAIREENVNNEGHCSGTSGGA